MKNGALAVPVTTPTIRLAIEADRDAIWEILEPVLRAGETYALPQDLTKHQALDYWLGPDRETFVLVEADQVLGTYYLRANQPGGGSHVGNCGYMTAPEATGRGVAKAMGRHSLERARARGFKALQFNFVVSSNTVAVRLWQNLGFSIVGTLPGAFSHPKLGEVDAYIMYQQLQ